VFVVESRPNQKNHATRFPAMTTPAPPRRSLASVTVPRPDPRSVARGRRSIGVTVATEDRSLLELLIQGLSLSTAMHMTGEPVTDASQLLPRLAGNPARLLLADEHLVKRLPDPTLSTIAADFPKLRVLLVGDRLRSRVVEDVARRRCHGFLLTQDLPGACARAVCTVYRGEIWLPRRLLERALFELPQSVDPRHLPAINEPSLTLREEQAVRCVVGGLTNKQIAERLGVCEDTIKKHLHSAFEKLGVQRRTQLIAAHSTRAADAP
jgi:DNA-binding NarL/FixJ family response regulator